MATVSLTALDKNQIQSQPYGNILQLQVGTYNLDNAYPKGGWAVSASQWGMQTVLGMLEIGTSATEGVVFKFDNLNTTLKAYTVVTGTTGLLQEMTVSTTAASMAPQFLVIGQ